MSACVEWMSHGTQIGLERVEKHVIVARESQGGSKVAPRGRTLFIAP